MTDRTKLHVPGKPIYWAIAGALGSLTGLGLGLDMSGITQSISEPAKWGGFGALIGTGVALMAVLSRRSE